MDGKEDASTISQFDLDAEKEHRRTLMFKSFEGGINRSLKFELIVQVYKQDPPFQRTKLIRILHSTYVQNLSKFNLQIREVDDSLELPTFSLRDRKVLIERMGETDSSHSTPWLGASNSIELRLCKAKNSKNCENITPVTQWSGVINVGLRAKNEVF